MTVSKKEIIVASILLLILLARYYIQAQTTSRLHDGQTIKITTTLLTEPTVAGKFQQFSVTQNNGSKITVMTSLYPQYNYGDTLTIAGTIKENKGGNGSPARGGISSQTGLAPLAEKPRFTALFPTITRAKDTNGPLGFLSFFRSHTITLFDTVLPQTSASLLLGIVFGIKEDMPKAFTSSLQQVGVVHVIAASGMNVTMVAGFLSSLFAFFFRRQVALLASIVGIILYGLLSGFEPSIMRASIMALFAFSAQILGRQDRALYALMLAAYVMLLFSPMLLQDIGFQLSFASTLGLLVINPLIVQSPRIQTLLERSLIGQDVATTVTAQLATIPILLANFGMYSLWSVVVNGLVLWVVPILMILGGFAALIGLLIPFVGQILLYLTLPFLSYFEAVVLWFAHSGGLVHIDSLPWQISVGYYCLLAGIVLYLQNRIGVEPLK